MVQETVNLIISRMDTMTDQEREQVMCALLNRFCVGCGRAGDWSHTFCDCEPQTTPSESCDRSHQLWLTYRAA
jgi:hypothetical protein